MNIRICIEICMYIYAYVCIDCHIIDRTAHGLPSGSWPFSEVRPPKVSLALLDDECLGEH